jgi:FixJ family two-component response regulator
LNIPPLISVIDDDASFRIATDSLLRAHGYTVNTFASAAEFLRSPQIDETYGVIADVQMPGMSGIELQTLLRKQGRSVPFIFVTAFPDEPVLVRALGDGAIGFLAKPFDSPTLIRCVEAALGHIATPLAPEILDCAHCRRRSGARAPEPMYRVSTTSSHARQPP